VEPTKPPDDPVIHALLAFWEQARGTRAMPSKADVDPLRLGPRLLPHIMLAEPVGDGRRIRYRLCGTAVAEAAGLDLTGLHVDELNPDPAYTRYIDGLYRRAIEARRPIYSESRYLAQQSTGQRVTRRLICPLSPDGVAVDRFIAAQSFQASGAGQAPTVTTAAAFDPRLVVVL
jgi:hypothetical protein